MPTASQIIDDLGGATKVADALDTPLTTVASWTAVNFIPRWWHQPLLALATKNDKALSTADFPPREARIKRAKKAEESKAA